LSPCNQLGKVLYVLVLESHQQYSNIKVKDVVDLLAPNHRKMNDSLDKIYVKWLNKCSTERQRIQYLSHSGQVPIQ